MSSSDELATFISSSFRSVWALELLLLLKRQERSCTNDELVSALRASSAVVEQAMASLVAAGLAGVEAEGARYMPVNAEMASLVDQTEQLYASRPDRVRRLIVAASSKGLAAFSDAFRLRD